MKTLITKHQAKAFFTEDAPKGDITTAAIFGKSMQRARAVIVAKQDLIVSGNLAVTQLLRHVFPKVRYECVINDGQRVKNKTVIARLSGSIQDLLLLERVSLNLLQHLCGIATLTNRFVMAVRGQADVLDTRKTLPGLRTLEKQAVLDGGGVNHRMSLSDMYLIKDNHIAAAGSVTAALEKSLNHRKKTKTPVEVEVTTLKQLQEALPLQPDIILLDNMTATLLHQAVNMRNAFWKKFKKAPQLEISGGVNLKTIAGLAKLGVERISVGALTHSAPAADLSLEILSAAKPARR